MDGRFQGRRARSRPRTGLSLALVPKLESLERCWLRAPDGDDRAAVPCRRVDVNRFVALIEGEKSRFLMPPLRFGMTIGTGLRWAWECHYAGATLGVGMTTHSGSQ